METTLVLLKPSCVQRQLIGEVVNRFERRGLRISGMKMMQLSDQILREHYAHLVDKPSSVQKKSSTTRVVPSPTSMARVSASNDCESFPLEIQMKPLKIR